ncbi:MAG: hypothetical protein ACK4TR_08785 [Phenylobacterium sp.]|uniref:hypothetical protein n=1 Tax=Phenylobacterium sp. TaxID=1871053 RepID=UPI00391DF292
MQTAEAIRASAERLIREAAALPPNHAARLLRERARRVHCALHRCRGDAFALAEARERLEAEARRLLAAN